MRKRIVHALFFNPYLPVPVRFIFLVAMAGSFDGINRTALLAPLAFGVKVTPIEAHVAAVSMGAAQAPATWKSAELVPVIMGEFTTRSAVPAFFMTIYFGPMGELTVLLPNPRDPGVIPILGGWRNVAVTVMSLPMPTVQVLPDVWVHPTQSLKTDPFEAWAVRMTSVPDA